MRLATVLAGGPALFLAVVLNAPAGEGNNSFTAHFNKISPVVSTVPANGDVNPYGVAIVPRTTGKLVENNILVSNFNNSKNDQGTGTTIVQITPDGTRTVFAQISAGDVPNCVGGVGLTTALVALRSGWVIVGSLPTSDGTFNTAQAGCLIVLNSSGKPVETFQGNGINGPWDMTALDFTNFAVLFVANVLNGTVAQSPNIVNQGTVLRIFLTMGDGSNDSNMPHELGRMVIGDGFAEQTSDSALVVGPTGLGLANNGTLYVADTLNNRIAAIPSATFRVNSAGTGVTVSQNGSLNGPLGLAIAPNGDILEMNGGDGNMVEITPGGTQVVTKAVDATDTGGGTLFGLAISPNEKGVYFVNDGDNRLYLLH